MKQRDPENTRKGNVCNLILVFNNSKINIELNA